MSAGRQLVNLFLDFTSRQIRRYYGLFALPKDQHLEVLRRWTNVAAWLASDFCLVPVGFILECPLLRRVLDSKSNLLTGGLIELPLRGAFDEFLARRRETYGPYADDHTDLYKDEVAKFVLKYAIAFKDRRRQSADSLVDRWSSGPDNSPLWLPVEKLGLRAIRRIARIPEIIHQNEAGIVWQGIHNHLKATDRAAEDDLQRILQSDFVESYCEEYETDTLCELPYGWRDLRRTPVGDASLSYRNFRNSLEPLGIRNLVEMLAAGSMIGIRSRPGYLGFLAKYRALASEPEELKRSAAKLGLHRSRAERLVIVASGRSRPGSDWILTSSELDELDELLWIASDKMPGRATMATEGPIPVNHLGDKRDGKMPNKRIAIFVALDEERQVFERSSLGFRKDRHLHHLIGEKDGVTLEVYCAHAMGRVAAAVATMEYLHETQPKPDLLLVTGLAGGFEAAKVSEGAVMIPEQIFDLALRKIKDDESPQFRPETYRADPRLKTYLDSNRFNRAEWAETAHLAADWPEHLRPSIRHDTLTSVDEVVSSVDHAEELMRAIPKLAGVEMEAGGVFAAARKLKVEVAVIRAISDKADPAKADNEWRKRAMKTIISLIEFIDLAKMLEQ